MKTDFNNLDFWLLGWIAIAMGIIHILSLGFYHPYWTLWAAKKIAKRKLDKPNS